MNVYENIVIIDASLSEAEAEASVKKISEIISSQGGELVKTDNWGRRKLAYEIKHHSRGHFIVFAFKSLGGIIKKLEDLYKVSEEVIKYSIVKLGKKQAKSVLDSVKPAEKQAEQPSETKPAEA